jgi:hypothetical protein
LALQQAATLVLAPHAPGTRMEPTPPTCRLPSHCLGQSVQLHQDLKAAQDVSPFHMVKVRHKHVKGASDTLGPSQSSRSGTEAVCIRGPYAPLPVVQLLLGSAWTT